ncbi:MAG: type I toxin-antitoxin system Fst family toxin [Jeotgalicoccus sp.]|nr:type I toxin-antitoxin system Fst family toxin [Jeotgalicoccus sp.]
MFSTFIELLLAPITVGTTIVLFSYWLNKDDK